jgi:hypothetical protein
VEGRAGERRLRKGVGNEWEEPPLPNPLLHFAEERERL